MVVHCLPVDVFLKIAGDKLILLGRRGSKSIERLKVMEKNSDIRLYVRKSDLKDCVQNNLTVAGVIMDKAEISDPHKVEFLARSLESVFREIETLGFNIEALDHTRQVSKSIQMLVAQKRDILGIIQMMSGISDDLLRHSVAVSAVSVAIAVGQGWTLGQTLEMVGLAALLHDVGLKEIPRDILATPRHELTYDQLKVYETHVYRGVDILRSMPNIPDEVVKVALEHHENCFGGGYPRRLRDYKISPMAKIVSLADCFAELTISNINNPNPKTADQAIQYIDEFMGQPFSKTAFVGLKKALKFGVSVLGKQS
jgi:putative nucleotidyltransferase with HDIG domain